jgi:hypothetical protein
MGASREHLATCIGAFQRRSPIVQNGTVDASHTFTAMRIRGVKCGKSGRKRHAPEEASMSELEQVLIVDVSRALLERLAPEELPLLRPHAEEFFRDPTRPPRLRRGGDQLLGFGPGEALNALTPVLLPVVYGALTVLKDAIKDSLRKQTSGALDGVFRRLLLPLSGTSSGLASEPPLKLSAVQLAAIRRVAEQKALELGLPEARARLLADAIVGSLAGQA